MLIGRRKKDGLLLGLFLIPTFFILILAQFYPLLTSVSMSFSEWSLVEWRPVRLVGLSNFREVVTNPQFRYSFFRTILFSAIVTPIQLLLGFSLASLVVGEGRFTQLSRTIFVIPMTIAPVAVGTMWRMLLNARAGLVNHLLQAVGLTGPHWLASPFYAFISLILIDIWQWTPFSLVMFVAALSSLSPEILNAAKIDGASGWQVLRYIIVPLLTPITLLIILFRFIDSMMIMDVIYTTTYGGPGFSTKLITFYTYEQAMKYFNLSYAAAASWVLQLFCLGFALVFLALYNRRQNSLLG